MKERLQKVMSEAGIDSRRHCEELIVAGKVKVNGVTVKKLPVLVDPQVDSILVHGKKLQFQDKVYYLLNKPKKVVCTNYDPHNRHKRTLDLMGGVKERIYPVCRLDLESQGLVLMTNDGELANLLTHPRYSVPKTYIVEINGELEPKHIEKLKRGFYVGKSQQTAMEHLKIIKKGHDQTILEMTLKEGRNFQISRMMIRLGYSVRSLNRIKFGPLSIRGLGIGHYRPLTKEEVRKLRAIANKPKQTTPKEANDGK